MSQTQIHKGRNIFCKQKCLSRSLSFDRQQGADEAITWFLIGARAREVLGHFSAAQIKNVLTIASNLPRGGTFVGMSLTFLQLAGDCTARATLCAVSRAFAVRGIFLFAVWDVHLSRTDLSGRRRLLFLDR